MHLDDSEWCVSYKTLEKCVILQDFGGNIGVLVPSQKIVMYNGSNTVTFENIKKLADRFENIQTEISKITEEYIDEEGEYRISMSDFNIGNSYCNFGCHSGYVSDILNIAKKLEQYENN